MTIKYKDLYEEGMNQFNNKYSDISVNEYDNLISELAESAYYSDGYGCDSDEESYFVITEGLGIEEGNKYMDEIITATTRGAA